MWRVGGECESVFVGPDGMETHEGNEMGQALVMAGGVWLEKAEYERR